MLTHSAGGWLGRVYMLDFGSEVRQESKGCSRCANGLEFTLESLAVCYEIILALRGFFLNVSY